LPGAVRSRLNQQLAEGVSGVKLVEWLNSLPEVRKVLRENFDGRAINEVNLSEWKGGGFADWQMQQELMASARAMAEDGTNMKAELEGVLTEHLSLVVAARYAQLLRGWNGEADEGFMKQLKALRMLCQDVSVLRRGDQRAGRLELQEKQFEQATKAENIKALECCLEESREYPEVAEAYRDAFILLKAYENGEKKNGPYVARQRQREEAKRERELVRWRAKREAQEEKERKKREAEEAEVAARKARWQAAHPGVDLYEGRWWEWEPEGGEVLAGGEPQRANGQG